MWFHKEIDVDKQVGKVFVTGIAPGAGALKAVVTDTTIPRTGKFAAVGAIPAIKKKEADFADPLCLTPDGTKDVAQAIFNERAIEFVRGAGCCVGLPELVPGRYIKLAGMDTHTNGTYFITRVIHRYDADGFVSKFYVGGAWSN